MEKMNILLVMNKVFVAVWLHTTSFYVDGVPGDGDGLVNTGLKPVAFPVARQMTSFSSYRRKT